MNIWFNLLLQIAALFVGVYIFAYNETVKKFSGSNLKENKDIVLL
jgi:hypothetical protein